MRILIITILLFSASYLRAGAQVIPGLPDLPPIPAEYDGLDANGVDPKMTNPNLRPSFPGGNDSLVAYLKRHLKLPAIDTDNKNLYSLIAGISVDSTGNFWVTETMWDSENEWPVMDEQIQLAIKSMPKWIPRRSQDGRHTFKGFISLDFFFQNNHLVVEINHKYLKIF